MSRFAAQVALVTGAARGIGRAVAARLLAEGARVFAVDLEAEVVQRAAAELSAGGGTVEAIAGDVASRDDVRRMVRTCIDRAGGLDEALDLAVENGRVYAAGFVNADLNSNVFVRAYDAK